VKGEASPTVVAADDALTSYEVLLLDAYHQDHSTDVLRCGPHDTSMSVT